MKLNDLKTQIDYLVANGLGNLEVLDTDLYQILSISLEEATDGEAEFWGLAPGDERVTLLLSQISE